MFRNILILTSLLISCSSYSQNYIEWTQIYETDSSRSAFYDVKQLGDGGYILVGERTLNHNLYVVKTDSIGSELWSMIFDSLGYGASVQVLDDGCFVFAGGHFLMKTSSGGEIIWQNTYDFTIHDMKKSGNEEFILGGDDPAENGGGLILVLTDSIGSEIWRNNFSMEHHSGEAYCCEIITATDGGYVFGGGIGDYFIVIKADSTGEEEWRYLGGDELVMCETICQSYDGGYIVSGWPYNRRVDMPIAKIDSMGNEIRSNGFWINGYAASLIRHQNQNYLLTGSAFYSYEYVTIYIKQFSDGLNGGRMRSFDYQYHGYHASAMIATEDGGFAIVGGISDGGAFLIKIAPNFANDIDENSGVIGIPTNFKVLSQYPNPFNSKSTVNIAFPRSGIIKINISNILGQTVQSTEFKVEAGITRYQVNGDSWNNGIYFSTFQFYNESITRKSVMLK
ncbi:MAG: T9SS type A sorting domain-containing protein [Candidatus Electryonea clarkiae]|nr:T9SS type A sorting domain-containing protein [Candidatus Electryonea clarkiae]MDP8285210.1 T9SS type A sorting domain-containing protein [Candidatus Electryonea clarkiae]